MIAFILLCYFCVNFVQILASPAPQLVFPDQIPCGLCPSSVTVVPIIDPNSDYYADVEPLPIPYVWPAPASAPLINIVPDYYYDNTFYDPVEDVVQSTLSELAQLSVNAEDFALKGNDFLNRFVDPYIV